MGIQKNENDIASQKFAKTLREIRKSKGMTISELAEHSTVSRTYITDLENGRGYVISKEKLSKILKALAPLTREEKKSLYLYYLQKTIPEEILNFILKDEK